MKFRRAVALVRDVPVVRFELRRSLAAVTGLVLISCAGCGDQQFKPASTSPVSGLSGTVHGGQQPITGATIQLYATGALGDGSSSTPLLSAVVKTDSTGSFDLSGLYTCPSAATNVYMTATGGNPGLQAGVTNPNIAALVALGPCGNLTASSYIEISELSTVAAVYALAPFMQSYSAVGSGALDSQLLASAFVTAGELVNPATGAIPGVGVPVGQAVPVLKIAALANILSTCINSAGGRAGDGSACGSLFTLATPPGGAPPTDTMAALLNIANNPTNQVVPLYYLSPPIAPFQPTMTSAPANWTLSMTSPTPVPAFSPAPGTYTSSPWITLSDTNAAAQIHYTTDGSTPSTSSPLYSGAISLPATGMIRAIAVAAGISSLPVAGTFTLLTPTIALTPSSVSLTQSLSQGFAAAVSGATNAAVTWSLTPAVGNISAAGLYTAPASISSAQTVTVTATSVADPAVTATSTIALVPPVSVAVSPGTVSLTTSQTQTFSATVANTANTAVTWSLSPAVGVISATGVYTAPPAISNAQTVAVTATSAADPTKYASATISLTLPVVPSTFFGLSVLDFPQLNPSISFGTTRSWDAGPGLDWSDANPSPGVYNFTPLDQFIAFNQARGSQGIYTFGRTPLWASSQPNNVNSPYGPGQCAPPSSMSYWDNYVTAIATHAAGRIKYWELWNEPNEATYCGDMPTIITMAQHAYQIIKSIDPTALILSPSADKASGPPWLQSFLSGGGAGSVDVIAFHGYWSTTAEDIVTVVAGFKAVAAANGLSNLPLWDTESSWGYTNMPMPTAEAQAAFIARYYLLHWSLGVARFTWYAYDAGTPWGTLYTYPAGESPAAAVYGETYQWMVGATLTAPCTEAAATNIWTCPLSRPGGYSAEAVWISNSSAAFAVPQQYTQYLDLAGMVHQISNGTVAVGDQPILLETGPIQ